MLIESRLQQTPESPIEFSQGVSAIERGGVKICRPLLTFSKDRLIATCTKKGVQWVEDETNQDRTLTARNAIRYMMKSNLLPPALTKQSLLKVAARVGARTRTRDGHVEDKLKQTQFQLDIRTGQLIIRRLPYLPLYSTPGSCKVPPKKVPPEQIDRHQRDYQGIAIRLLHRLVSLVTPQKSVPLRDLENFVPLIFPLLWDQSADDAVVPNFTVGGVQFSGSVNHHESEDVEITWTLHRQPMNATQRKNNTLQFPVPLHHQSAKQAYARERSHWILWDGRYWTRLYGRGLEKYRIRAFEPEDQEKYMNGLQEPQRRWLSRIFQLHAKGKVKWTLPVIAKIEDLGTNDAGRQTSRAVALPILGTRLPNEEICWDTHYKQIDLGKKSLDALDPPFDLVRAETMESMETEHTGNINP